MSLFVGRQPILDRNLTTYGYELLFRDGSENVFTGADADKASLTVIDTSVALMGLAQVTGGKRSFINFTRKLLVEDFGFLLPRDQVVIEVLENIIPDEEVVDACHRLKKAGYTLALDDFEYAPHFDPLLQITDIIKVDIETTDNAERLRLARTYLPLNIRMLAERVETMEDYEQTKEMGYSYFQGYFFSKPTVLTTEHAPESKLARLQLLNEINRSDFDFLRAEAFIKHDPTLTMKLFRYINSVIFGMPQEVKSIRQALTLLGEKNIRKWATILIISTISEDKPAILLQQAVVRAKFCELLAGLIGHAARDQEFFMTGMFSLLDTMMSQTMEQLLTDLPLAEEIKLALQGEPSLHLDMLNLTISFENSDWQQIAALSSQYNLDEDALAKCQLQSFEWADQLTGA